ncbi:MAG: hypothetical protein ABJB74_05665 [Gemmatimonas sp.]
MEQSFLIWTGKRGQFGVWIPIFYPRPSCTSGLTIRVEPVSGWINDIAPVDRTSLTIGLYHGSVPEIKMAPPVLPRDEPSVEAALGNRVSKATVHKAGNKKTNSKAKRQVNRECNSRSPDIGKMDCLTRAVWWANAWDKNQPLTIKVLKTTRLPDADRECVAICVRHDTPPETAPLTDEHIRENLKSTIDSGLVRVTVTEHIEIPHDYGQWITLWNLPGYCDVSLALLNDGKGIPLGELSLQVLERNPSDGAALDMDIIRKGIVRPDFTDLVHYDEGTGNLRVRPLSSVLPEWANLGAMQLQFSKVAKSQAHAAVTVPSLDVNWSDSAMGRLLAFAYKTGWLDRWTPRVIEADHFWRLAPEIQSDFGAADVSFPSFFAVLSGSGTWPLAAFPEMKFQSPCVLGAPPILPDASRDHQRRFNRWVRLSEAAENGTLAQADSEKTRWFVARSPLLASTREAKVTNGPAEVLEVPYAPELHRFYAETWIDDGLHESMRYLVAGDHKWDGMLGTLHSYCGSIFRELQPTGRPDELHKWPHIIGSLVPIAAPVASSSGEEFHKAYKASVQSSNNQPHVGRPRLTFRRADTPTETQQFAQDALQALPAGCISRQGTELPGLIVVPTGFSIVVQAYEKAASVHPVIANAARTPRMFGELESGVLRDPFLAGGASKPVPSMASVFYFRDCYPEDDDAGRRPARLALAFVVHHSEYAGDDDVERAMRTAIVGRSHRMANAIWRESLFFAHHPIRSMEEWLYRAWKDVEAPSSDAELLQLPDLLVAAVLHMGEPAELLDVGTIMKYWTKGERKVNKSKVSGSNDSKEQTESESMDHNMHIAAVHPVPTLLERLVAEYKLNMLNTENPTNAETRYALIGVLRRLLARKGITVYTDQRSREKIDGMRMLQFKQNPMDGEWEKRRTRK